MFLNLSFLPCLLTVLVPHPSPGRFTLEDQIANVRTREVADGGRLESLKGFLHHKLARNAPASRVKEQLKILGSYE